MKIELPPSHSTAVVAVEVGQGVNPFYSAPNAQSSIVDFPTTGQYVIDTTMKEMLLSLPIYLFANFSSLLK